MSNCLFGSQEPGKRDDDRWQSRRNRLGPCLMCSELIIVLILKSDFYFWGPIRSSSSSASQFPATSPFCFSGLGFLPWPSFFTQSPNPKTSGLELALRVSGPQHQGELWQKMSPSHIISIYEKWWVYKSFMARKRT